MQQNPATGYFQCKKNHFETRAITLYLFVEIIHLQYQDTTFQYQLLYPV